MVWANVRGDQRFFWRRLPENATDEYGPARMFEQFENKRFFERRLFFV